MSNKRSGLRPGKPLTGALSLDASKSLAQRALIAAALCGETTWIARLPAAGAAGADLQRARELLSGLGAQLDSPIGSSLRVRGLPPGPSRGWRAGAGLQFGESATLARLATAAAGLCGREGEVFEFGAAGSLLRRGSPALFASLAAAGVRFEFCGRADGWPLSLRPIGPPSQLSIRAVTSSQEVSALLLAAAAWPDEIEVCVSGAIPSRPYVEMTIATLRQFGVEIAQASAGELETFVVHGPLRAPAQPLLIEPDASAAAVLLAAACISGGHISVPGILADSPQGDTRIVEHLAAFGCEAGFDSAGIFAGGDVRRGARVDLSGEPDLAPVLAAVAAVAALRSGQRSLLCGLGTLQGKESARIRVLADALGALGLAVIATETTLDIFPGHASRGPLELDPHGDHRMAFAFALLGLAREGIDVLDPGCVAKSWPHFWRDMQRAGATLVGDSQA